VTEDGDPEATGDGTGGREGDRDGAGDGGRDRELGRAATPRPDAGAGRELAGAAARTSLAWRRSGLALVACGFAIARGFTHVGVPAQPAVGVIVLAVGLGLWLLANAAARRWDRLAVGERPAATYRELAVVAGATGIAGVVAFAVAVSR
jgi:uncharacterized membrane protein YidH (DUF202 family)